MNEVIWSSGINSNHMEVKSELLSWQDSFQHFSLFLIFTFVFVYMFIFIFVPGHCFVQHTLPATAGSVKITHLPRYLGHSAQGVPPLHSFPL